MRDLVHPAISSLERQIADNQFSAVKYVLDWAGFRADEQPMPSDTAINVTVLFDHASSTNSSLPDPT